jgi:hypothetical protein
MKELNWFWWTMSAPHTCVSKQAIKVQKMTELRPSLNDTGAKKKPPVASPAEAAEFYRLLAIVGDKDLVEAHLIGDVGS